MIPYHISNLLNHAQAMQEHKERSLLCKCFSFWLCGCDSIIKNPVGGTYPWPGVSYLGKSIEQARGEHALLRETLEKEYKEQDLKAAEVVKWAIKQF
jgi:hypothetical protein